MRMNNLTNFILVIFLINCSFISIQCQNKRVDLTGFMEKQYIERKQKHEYWAGSFVIGKDNVYYPTEEKGSNSTSFYMFVTADSCSISSLGKKPIILWLQGGPGASSLFGLFTEFGPMFVHKKKDSEQRVFVENAYTWGKNNHLLFIDNPIGVGFSQIKPSEDKVGLPTGVQQSVTNLEKVLRQFKQEYNIADDHPFYVFGESFGGNYAPALTALLIKNKDINKINIQGMLIVDGWAVNPLVQLPAYAEYYYTTGLISTKTYKRWKEIDAKMTESILTGDYKTASKLLYNYDGDNGDDSFIKRTFDINMHNTKQYGQNSYEQIQYLAWFDQNQKELNGLLGFPADFLYSPRHYRQDIYESFYGDTTRDFSPNVTYILNNHVKVLIFNGQIDPDVPSNGAMNWIFTLDWYGRNEFFNSKKQIWKSFYKPKPMAMVHPTEPVAEDPLTQEENIAGFYKKYSELTFVLINKAGHMVPLDQPYWSLEMVDKWLKNELNEN